MENTILNITLKRGAAAQQAATEPGPLPELVFKGPESTPFLAPRGVFLRNDQLFVSDTGRNRVFIWKKLSENTFQEPDVVLGQDDTDSVGRNSGGAVSAHSLQYPSGIWSDGQRLIVADAWNHRVLIWHELPRRQGQPAEEALKLICDDCITGTSWQNL